MSKPRSSSSGLRDARRQALPPIVAVLAMIAVTAITLAGCNILTPAAYVLVGTGSIEPEYVLEDRPTLVYIDDLNNVVDQSGVLSPREVRLDIAERVSRELMTRELVLTTISPRDGMAIARAKDRHNDLMPIDAIGRAAGAAQVIYIQILTFSSTADGFQPRPFGSCRVRVIDVDNRQRLFPPEDSDDVARAVSTNVPQLNVELYRSTSSRNVVFEYLAQEMALDVAELFYEHEPREVGSNLDPSQPR